MTKSIEEQELSSDFQPLPGEANFGHTITKEVVGGTHIAPQCITHCGDKFIMIEFKHGLPRHDKSGPRLRFPHGLMMFGETFQACAKRLVAAQMGATVIETRIAHVYSQVDEMNHWHLEPIVLVRIESEFNLPDDVTKAVYFEKGNMPKNGHWICKPPFSETYSNYLKNLL